MISSPGAHRRAALRATWIGLLAIAALGPCVRASDPPAVPSASAEYELKAVFILNFTRFAEWPPAAFTATNAPIVIGILGENPFGPLLRNTVRGESVGGRPLLVEDVTDPARLASCHVVFVSRSERPRLRGLLAGLHRTPVLTVSEIEGFCEAGGMIQLVVKDQTVRFAINPSAATAAGLQLSAKLLRLAPTIGTVP